MPVEVSGTQQTGTYMANPDPFKLFECQLGVDFGHDTFLVVLEKLATSGMTTFRLNWKPDITVCIAFNAAGSRALNTALDSYLENWEQSL